MTAPVAPSPAHTTDNPVEVLELLLDLSATLAAQRSYSDLLESVARHGRQLLRAARMEILTLDYTNCYLLPAAADPPADGIAPGSRVPLYNNGTERNVSNPASFAAFTGRIVQLPDIYKFTGFDFGEIHQRDRILGRRTTSYVAVPLRNHDAMTIGVVQAFDIGSAAVSGNAVLPPWMARGLLAFTSMAAVAMTNLRLIEDKQRLIRQLGRSNDTLVKENARLRSEVGQASTLSEIVGSSPAIHETFQLIERTVDSNVTVLLLGETGSGKEVLAQAVHRKSQRRDGPFIVQNCAALPEHLLESELFGHKRGAFTGAHEAKIGLFQAADRGTLFLDEIGDMPLGLQGKLLRVLQDGEVRPIGETRSRRVDVRIIAATNADLREKVRNGAFREDLFYRICVFPIRVPPLRERRPDILLLSDHFLARTAAAHGRQKPRLARAAADLLEQYDYPGNVRELKNAIERALLLSDGDGLIEPAHLPLEIAGPRYNDEIRRPGPVPPDAKTLKTILQRYETVVLATMLEDHGWNQTRAARKLGISRRSLVEKIQRYGIRHNSAGEV
jgi:sigma-54-dependent transcriptional regulator